MEISGTIKKTSGNLSGAVGGGLANVVRYTEQTLTDEQKAQARENIGAVTIDEVMDSLYDSEEVAY